MFGLVWRVIARLCHDGVGKNLQDEAEEFQKTNFIPGALECDKTVCKDSVVLAEINWTHKYLHFKINKMQPGIIQPESQ